jgi:hypothetical protein
MARGRRSEVSGVDEVRARFEQWRQNRRGKARIPDELWSAAVDVARGNGCNRTAAVLHLDGGKLRKQMLAAGVVTQKPTPAFLELIPPQANGMSEYTIELEGRGGTLRIHCKGATAMALAELSRALWSLAS